MREEPRELQIYRHFRGTYYQVLSIAKQTETNEKLVIYRSLYEPDKIYARPLTMFMEELDRKKYPDTDKKYRFELITGEIPKADTSIHENRLSENQLSETKLSENRLPENRKQNMNQENMNQENMNQENMDRKSVRTADIQPVEEDFDDSVLDPELEKFLDEKTYEKKLERLVFLKKKADDEMLNTIAMSLDLELSKTTTEEKYLEILDCLKTLEKYECNRLR